jgi:hypothetical protein
VTEPKSFRRASGECCDKHGIPIHIGDLLRTPHFRGPRRKLYYLYHVAVFDQACCAMRMISVRHLDEGLRTHPDHRGGCPLLDDRLASEAEVIDGCMIDGKLWNERPRRERAKEVGGQ